MNSIVSARVETHRLATRVLTVGDPKGEAVVFLHGNVSSADWWSPTLKLLADRFRGIAPDLRGYGESDPDAHVDATKGMADHVEDVISLLDSFEIDRFHAVGSSLGGVVVWAMMASHPERLLTVSLAAPGSPFGFGATKDTGGTPTTDDFAGSGGGLVNPEFLSRLAEGDRSADSPFSPRSALRLLTAVPLDEKTEDMLLDGLLATNVGDRDYPGDVVASTNWPYVGPGDWGSTNALSPKHLAGLAERILEAEDKPPVLWVRGDRDVVVADAAASDPGTWGPSGLVPNYPGPEVYPPQPMLAQTRTFLERYQARGGWYQEVVMGECGHLPYVEMPKEFTALLEEHLSKQTNEPNEEEM